MSNHTDISFNENEQNVGFPDETIDPEPYNRKIRYIKIAILAFLIFLGAKLALSVNTKDSQENLTITKSVKGWDKCFLDGICASLAGATTHFVGGSIAGCGLIILDHYQVVPHEVVMTVPGCLMALGVSLAFSTVSNAWNAHRQDGGW